MTMYPYHSRGSLPVYTTGKRPCRRRLHSAAHRACWMVVGAGAPDMTRARHCGSIAAALAMLVMLDPAGQPAEVVARLWLGEDRPAPGQAPDRVAYRGARGALRIEPAPTAEEMI